MSDIRADNKKRPNVLTNELVYRLTNRQGPFIDGLIPTNKNFRPEKQSELWTSLRSGLFLDYTGTDYFIVLAVSILKSYPDIYYLFKNRQLSFNPVVLNKYRSSVEDGTFFTSGNRIGEVLPYTDYFPIVHEYKIKYHEEDLVLITTDIGREFKAACKIFPKGAGSALAIDWPKRLPFKGPIRSDLSWTDGSQITIKYIPKSIDFEQWLHYIEGKLLVERVLTPLGLYTVYQLSKAATQKIALLIAALALQNSSIKSE
jgi:hypothetical protein